jgi:hypothetical protein
MTELDRKIEQLRRLLYATHYENYDFIYLPAADALTIVRLLDYRRSKNAEANRRKNDLPEVRGTDLREGQGCFP